MPARVLAFRRPAFALLLLVGALGLRWSSLDRQVWNLDEGSTITMAQQVLAGQVPYREAADNRTPLVPYAKALVLAVAGDWNARAVHLVVALMLGLTAILLWLIARQHGHEPAGVIAAFLFTWVSVGYLGTVDTMTAHTGWFVIFLSSAGFWLFGHALQRQSTWFALGSGAAFGLSFLAKQPGLLDFGVTLVLLALLAGFAPGPRPPLARLAAALVAGLLAPVAATALYFQQHGALADLLFYAWTYNTRYYVPEVPLAERLWAIRMPFLLLATRLPVILLVGLAAVGRLLPHAFASLRHRTAHTAVLAWLILGWLAAGLGSTVLSGRDFSHYSIQFIPGSCLACGWLLAHAWEKVRAWRAAGLVARCRIAQFAAAAGLASIIGPTVAWVARLDTSDGASAEIGRLVQAYSQPRDRIFVWGYMPEMHVYARRLPSTRFFYTNWVTGMIPWTNLDWLKDTAYAIVPGTPEQLRQDFDRRPPTVIVDTGSTRGYAKYPLEAQTWLWAKIEREFAEVDPDYARRRGFRVYRRIADARYGAPFPAELSATPEVKVELPAQGRPVTTPVRVTHPAGTTAIELYKDGELYRRLACPADRAGAVVFSVLGTDLPEGTRRLQALARGGRDLASAPRPFLVDPGLPPEPAGPPLEFEHRAIAALAATNLVGPMQRVAHTDRWDARTPARLVYERPPGMYSLEIEYGLDDTLYEHPANWSTNGLEVAVQFQPPAGPPTTLFRRYLNSQLFGRDRGPQREHIALPVNEPGRLILWMMPGPMNDVSSDLAYWKSVRGTGAPGAIFFRDQRINAIRLVTPFGFQETAVQGFDAVMVHAPSQLDFPLQKGMHRLTGTLGLLQEAWNGPKKSSGAIFEFWHVPPTGDPRLLHYHRSDPANDAAQRKPASFAVDLPYPSEGLIRLVTLPAHPQDNAFNYTYWGPLIAEDFSMTLQTPDQPVRSLEAETTYGFSDLQVENRPVVFAHAPSRIVFPQPAGLGRLSGQIGLLAGAYTGPRADATAGGLFIIEVEDAAGRRTAVWQRELNPRDDPADRGFIPFSVPLPPGDAKRLILRTDARPGHGPGKAWTFWHGIRLEP